MTQYELVNKVYFDNEPEINKRVALSKFPETYRTLKAFHFKTNDFLTSLIQMEQNENFYSSQCLSRVLYEHFLVAYFIWTRTRVEQNDECAIDYTQHYATYEMIKQENYNSKLDKSYDSKKSPLENFLLKAPEFNDPIDPLNQANIDDINKRANKFDVRNILKYLENELDPKDEFKSIQTIVLEICKGYNKLSSYVHGGRTAELATLEDTPRTDKAKVLKDNVEWAKFFNYEILTFIMLLLIAENKSFMKFYQPIYDFTNQK